MSKFVKKAWSSLTNWEGSFFGGYNRVIADHPFIDTMKGSVMDTKLADDNVENLGYYSGPKLLKMYLLDYKNSTSNTDLMFSDPVEVFKSDITGKTQKYLRYPLSSNGINHHINGSCSKELKPLFMHYEKYLKNCFVEIPVDDDKNGSDGKGEGENTEGEDDKQNQNGSGDSNEGENPSDQEDSQPTNGESGSDPSKDPKEEFLTALKKWEPMNLKSLSSTTQPEPVFITYPKTGKDPVNFDKATIKDAEFLLKLLDVNFESKSSIIKSLKAGKLDTSKIAEIPAGNLSVYQQDVEETDTQPFAFVILADLSGSMQYSDLLSKQLRVLNMLYVALSQILPSDKLFIYGHTTATINGNYDCPVIHEFHSPTSVNAYDVNIHKYDSISCRENSDGPVVEAIHKKVRSTTSDRIIFLQLADGQPHNSEYAYGGPQDLKDFERIMERARRDNFVTAGVGINYCANPGIYKYLKVVNHSDIAKDVAYLINKVIKTEFQ